ncbi:type II secretion system F family protein [Gluconobacter oxydans]|uniref:type II secretion system F family protein n=1 Tax=Gluconobacter oxydans TaxID=442 RepID=UPI0039E964E4
MRAGRENAWRYTALSPEGLVRHGRADGASEEQVILSLRRAGLVPIRLERASGFRPGLRLPTLSWRRSGLTRAEVTDITRELSLMLGAGLELDRAMRFLVETLRSSRQRAMIEQLRDAMRGGGAFAAALATRPETFPPLYVGLVRAGEAGGALGVALDRLASLMERERALASSIQSALIYPAILVVASVGAVVMLLTEILPQFVPLFQDAGARLPLATQVVITAGDLLSQWGWALLVTVLLTTLAGRILLARPAIRLAVDRIILRVPVLGGLTRDVMAAQLTRTLGTLLENGVPLLGALRICEAVVGNLAGRQAIRVAESGVREGGGLSRPLDAQHVFPPRTIHLLRLGEETAQLGPLCLRAAALHETAAQVGLQRLVALLVPAITIIMGAIVAGIVSALLLAMLGLNDLAK